MKIKAEMIECLPGGRRVIVNGIEYIRMVDSPSRHIEGCILDADTGTWVHWSRLVLGTEEVEVVDD
jgi:hypothetical protein